MEPSKHFDNQIKKALGGLESTYDPSTWDALQQRLDAADGAGFDEVFKSKLDSLQAPLGAASWEAMEQLIEADEAAEVIASEAGVDNLAYEKLHNLEVPFQNQHWALMARRLEEEFSLRHQLYRYKAMEVSLLLLLLLAMVRFLPHAENWWNAPALQPGQDTSPVALPQSDLPTGPTASIPEILPDEQPARLAWPNQSEAPALATDEKLPTENPDETTVNSVTQRTLPRAASSATAKKLAPLPTADLGQLASNSGAAPLMFEQLVGHRLQNGVLPALSLDIPDKLAALPASPVRQQFAWEALPQLKTSIFEQPKALRFTIFTTTDLNYIETPSEHLSVFDTLITTKRNNSLAMGYGGGVLISLKKDRFELQTGGVYSFKRYLPNTPVFLFETVNYYVREDFNGIQLDILQVPLSANYHFKDSGKWRFYGSAGAAGHFITSSVYEIAYQRTTTFNLMPPPSSPDDTRSIRQEKEFPEGLADGGQLRDNLYFTLNAGFGVERYLSPKWVLFLQPNYQHYLGARGVGTNKDRISTTSLHLGTKFSLK